MGREKGNKKEKNEKLEKKWNWTAKAHMMCVLLDGRLQGWVVCGCLPVLILFFRFFFLLWPFFFRVFLLPFLFHFFFFRFTSFIFLFAFSINFGNFVGMKFLWICNEHSTNTLHMDDDFFSNMQWIFFEYVTKIV